MKLPKTSHLELYLLIVGLSIRLLIAPFTKDPWDMNTWMSIGSAIYSGQNPYALSANALVYPPLWGIFCATSYIAYTLTNNPFTFYFTIKLPIIIADVLISIILRKIVFKITNDAKKARIAMLLYLFNPVTIIFSSLWGMFDAIPVLFALLAILYLSEGKHLKSGILLGIGIGFKGFFPALLLPFFLFYIWKKEKKITSSLKYAVYSTLVPLLISTPFLATAPNSYIGSLFFHIGKVPQNFTYWFSLRSLFEAIGISTNLVISLGSYIFIISFALLYLLIGKKAEKWGLETKPFSQKLLRGSILVLFAFFITSSTISEQYSVWILPLLILYMTNYDSTLKPHCYSISILVTLFVAANVGPRFFAPIIAMPLWWNNLQYSWPVLLVMASAGILFSGVCIKGFIKLTRITAPYSDK
jgi:Gpi18-like mannosyltransferase